MSDYPRWICMACGGLHGRKLGSIIPGLSLSTYHDGDPADPTDRCGWCGTTENLTEPRDYGYPSKPTRADSAQYGQTCSQFYED